jgi:hypothetical protein
MGRDEGHDCKSDQYNGEKVGWPAGAGGSSACDHDAGYSEAKAVDGWRELCRFGRDFTGVAPLCATEKGKPALLTAARRRRSFALAPARKWREA